MKLKQLNEVRYSTKGLILSVSYTLMDPAATQEKPYVFFKYGDVHHDKIPRKSTFFESVERANDFIRNKRDALDKKIRKLKREYEEIGPDPGPGNHRYVNQNLNLASKSREIMDRVKVVSITTKYET